MDVIITGATGFVGGAVVRHAIETTVIKHAFVLTRKPLPEHISTHSKVTVIQLDDFLTYPPALLSQLAGCKACIWCIGGRAYQFPDKATAKMVSVDYPVAAATAFTTSLAPGLESDQKFRFVFVSGKFAEWDQSKSLLFLRDTRRMKGSAEERLLGLAAENSDKLDVVVVRPAGIMAAEGGCVKSNLGKLAGFIDVDHLARDLVILATEGSRSPIVDDKELMRM